MKRQTTHNFARGSRCLIAVALLMAGSVQAQLSAPKFEVASIKHCTTQTAGEGRVQVSPGRLRFDCTTVDTLIRDAYVMFGNGPYWRRIPGVALPMVTVSPGQLSLPIKGSSDWIRSERFTIDAMAAKSQPPASEEAMHGPMMQTLLKDKFKPKLHRESQEVPIYELTVAKGVPKLQPAKTGGCTIMDPAAPPPPREKGQNPPPLCGAIGSGKNGGLDVNGVTLAYLCLLFSMSMDHDVIDKTGIAGAFDIHLDLSRADLGFGLRGRSPAPTLADAPASPIGAASDPGGTLNDALHKIGLKLEPAKGRYDVLVIDHVERPAAN